MRDWGSLKLIFKNRHGPPFVNFTSDLLTPPGWWGPFGRLFPSTLYNQIKTNDQGSPLFC